MPAPFRTLGAHREQESCPTQLFGAGRQIDMYLYLSYLYIAKSASVCKQTSVFCLWHQESQESPRWIHTLTFTRKGITSCVIPILLATALVASLVSWGIFKHQKEKGENPKRPPPSLKSC